MGTGGPMPDQSATRRRAVVLIVLGVIVAALGAMLLIGVLEGDETDQVDPQNGQVLTHVFG
jgi:hypothetical protein